MMSDRLDAMIDQIDPISCHLRSLLSAIELVVLHAFDAE